MQRVGLAVALAFAIALPAGAGMPERQKKWIEDEVRFLVTKDDEKAFKGLKSDEDRDRYAEIFWARRDPTPLTPANEVKDEHYRRLLFVQSDKFPRARGSAHSDMARVFVLLGQPTKQERDGDALIWIYAAQPKLGATHPLRFAFQDKGDGLELDTSRSDGLGALSNAPAAMILHPEIVAVPTYPHVMDKTMAALIDGLAQGGQSRADLPCEISVRYLRTTGGATLVSLIAELSQKSARLAAFGRCQHGDSVQEFNEQMETIPLADRTVAYTGLPVMPGAYDLYIGIVDQPSGKTTLRQVSLAVPDFAAGTLAMIDPMLSDKVEPAPAPSSGVMNPFAFGRYHMTPKLDATFSSASSLNILYVVYNCTVTAGEAEMAAEYIFKKDGQYFNRIPPEASRQKVGEAQAIVMGQEVPLESFPAGNYTLTVKLEDKLGGGSVSKDVPFVVK